MYSLPCWPLTYEQVSKAHWKGVGWGRKFKAESKECVDMATIWEGCCYGYPRLAKMPTTDIKELQILQLRYASRHFCFVFMTEFSLLFWLCIHFVLTIPKHWGKYRQFPVMAGPRNFRHYNELKAKGTQMKLYIGFELLTPSYKNLWTIAVMLLLLLFWSRQWASSLLLVICVFLSPYTSKMVKQTH